MMTNNNRRNGKRGKNGTPASMQNSVDQAGQPVEEESLTYPNTTEGQQTQTEASMMSLARSVGPTVNEPDLGMTIRRLRESRQLSLKEVAARSGLTQSFLSQVERNLTSPSVASLRKVALALGVPLAALFQGPMTPEDHVVRRNERRQLVHPKRQWRDYLLTPNLVGKLQVILSVIEPGGGSGDEPYTHDSDEECVVILRGRLEFWVGTDRYLLEEGDSIVFESRIPHRNRNPGPDQAEVLWITTPPSY
jgi:transcriptional regulator with XRE-family HTH domain